MDGMVCGTSTYCTKKRVLECESFHKQHLILQSLVINSNMVYCNLAPSLACVSVDLFLMYQHFLLSIDSLGFDTRWSSRSCYATRIVKSWHPMRKLSLHLQSNAAPEFYPTHSNDAITNSRPLGRPHKRRIGHLSGRKQTARCHRRRGREEPVLAVLGGYRV